MNTTAEEAAQGAGAGFPGAEAAELNVRQCPPETKAEGNYHFSSTTRSQESESN